MVQCLDTSAGAATHDDQAKSAEMTEDKDQFPHDDEEHEISLPHRKRHRHVKRKWYGSIGLSVAKCLRSHSMPTETQTGATDPNESNSAATVPSESDTECPTGFDTAHMSKYLPPNFGLLLDASVTYTITRSISLTGALLYEPIPGVLITEAEVSFEQQLPGGLFLLHELSASLAWQRGQPVYVIPEAIRGSETLTGRVDQFTWDIAAFIEPTLGEMIPEFFLQDRGHLIDLKSTSTVVQKSVWNHLRLTAGSSTNAELRLSRHWSASANLSTSKRFGTEPSPATLIEINPLTISLHLLGWVDELALDLASSAPRGPYHAGLILSFRRNF